MSRKIRWRSRRDGLHLSRRQCQRARPLKVPSSFSVMRSLQGEGATVIMPAGDGIPAWASSQPASMVSASGTATAARPAACSTPKPSARSAPEPPQSSGTQDQCQSGVGQRSPERAFVPRRST